MSSTGIGGGANAGGSSSGNLPGGHAPGSAPMVNPTLAEVATLVDWFGHPNNNIFDGMALTSLPVNLINCSPVVTKAALISLKPAAPLAFFWTFPVCKHPSRTYAPPHVSWCLSLYFWYAVSLFVPIPTKLRAVPVPQWGFLMRPLIPTTPPP